MTKRTGCGFIDTSGKFVLEPDFVSASSFGSGLALVETTEGNWSYIDTKGNTAWAATGDHSWFADGLTRLTVRDKKGNSRPAFVDTKGKQVIAPLDYDYVGEFAEGLCPVRIDGMTSGLIDRNGKLVMKFPEDHNLHAAFSGGMAPLNKSTRPPAGMSIEEYWFIDTKGKKVFEGIFDGALRFSEDLAAVSQKQRWGYIDRTGKVVIPFRWKRHSSYEAPGEFHDGLARIWDKKYGFIDKTGEFVIPPEFAVASEFSSGLAAVEIKKKWGFIDRNGKLVIDAKFKAAESFSDGLARVEV